MANEESDLEKKMDSIQSKVVIEKIMEKLGDYTLVNYTICSAVYNDTSLGLPKKGQCYAPVLTPGYEVRLFAMNQKTHRLEEKVYRTNISANVIIEDEKSQRKF